MSKRGRKNKGGVRTTTGRLNYRANIESRIGPTAELLARKIAHFRIAGVVPDGKNKIDLSLSESWLGILFAAKVITREQYDAGNKMFHLWKTMFPQSSPQSCLDPDTQSTGKSGKVVQLQSHGDGDDVPDYVGEQFKLTQKLLGAWDRRTRDIVINLCCFDRFQRFIDVQSSRQPEAWAADARDKTRLLTALEGLAELYGILPRKSAQRMAA